MKKCSVVALLLVIVLGNVFAQSRSNRSTLKNGWTVIAVGAGITNHSYNPKRLVRLRNGIIRVWIKETLMDDKPETLNAFLEMKRKMGDSSYKYRDFSHALDLLEYDCKKQRSRVIQATDYDKAGIAIESLYIKSPKWSYIVPGSVGEIIMDKLCQ